MNTNTESDQSQPSSKFSWFDVPKSIWYFLGKYKSRYVFFTALLFVISFYELVPAFIAGKIVDFFTQYEQGGSLKTFYMYVAILGTSYALASLVRLATKNKLIQIGIHTKANAREQGFERMINLPLLWHAQENTGNKIQRVFNGANALEKWAGLVNKSLFPVVTSFIGVISIFAFLNPLFSLFLVVYLFIFLTIQIRFNKKISHITDEENILSQRASGAYFEASNNLLSVKAMGSEKDTHSRVQISEERAKELQLRRAAISTQKWYYFQIFNGVAIALFFLLIGNQVTHSLMTVGEILIFYVYFSKLRDAANDTNDLMANMIQLKSDLAHMMPIFREESTIQTGSLLFPTKWTSLKIIDGSLTYPSGQEALKGINFSLYEGEKLGVAGESGSSKSTLIKILLGLYQLKSGQFLIGDKNYYDISHESLIQNISVVLQETELFNLSLKDNITGMREVSAELLLKAIEVSGLENVIKHLPDGLDTLIGEKGYKLSGGERQRVGIARAMCKDSPIILLDEATSSLDSKTEKEVLDKLFGTFGKEKTFLVIAHRISTLRNSDRVVVFEKGQIIEEGKYAPLLKNEFSRLGHLHKLQSQKH